MPLATRQSACLCVSSTRTDGMDELKADRRGFRQGPEMTITPTAEAVPGTMNSKSAVAAKKGGDEACHSVTAAPAAWAGIPNT